MNGDRKLSIDSRIEQSFDASEVAQVLAYGV